jgi:hypothetical protein
MHRLFSGNIFQTLTEEEGLYGWFQQDTAATNIARMSIQPLTDGLGDRIISSGIWPAHSPDLNPCDYFLLVLFKG